MKCKLCGKEITEMESNNGQPVTLGRVCDDCNINIVVPARIFGHIEPLEYLKLERYKIITLNAIDYIQEITGYARIEICRDILGMWLQEYEEVEEENE